VTSNSFLVATSSSLPKIQVLSGGTLSLGDFNRLPLTNNSNAGDIGSAVARTRLSIPNFMV
jgi:hypothetical protein